MLPFEVVSDIEYCFHVEQSVLLQFAGFLTEACCDYIHIYDGYNTLSKQLASLSGTVSPSTEYWSTQIYMYLRFITDGSVAYNGFTATFSSTGEI